MARAWAVVQEGEPLPNTVSSTRRGALVNWLVIVAQMRVLNSWSDADIEAAWVEHSMRRQAHVSPVTVQTVSS
jgi:hypothetical protein